MEEAGTARSGRVATLERREGPEPAELEVLAGRDLRSRPRSVQRYEPVGVATSKKPGAMPVTMPSTGAGTGPLAGMGAAAASSGSSAEMGESDVVRIRPSRAQWQRLARRGRSPHSARSAYRGLGTRVKAARSQAHIHRAHAHGLCLSRRVFHVASFAFPDQPCERGEAAGAPSHPPSIRAPGRRLAADALAAASTSQPTEVCRARGSAPGSRAFRSASPHHCSHADATARRRKILPPNATRPRLPATRPPITVTCGPRRISPTMRSQPDKLSRKHSPRDSLPGEVELCTDDFVRMTAHFAAEWRESPDNPVRMPQYRMIGVPSGVQL